MGGDGWAKCELGSYTSEIIFVKKQIESLELS